ncbi:uncharacterized protein CCOS01_11718 [Colletotrichum costaricense]|uniref:Uncharacterized protein n=1 Tax=Colletotrichum costaricense TaxID=1209916 RepID=A0AAI9YPI2_9PEZI|nr:uncharacterized protein CCOS01_11718 [Colletotrichum costaricense]KAK1518898.1 hypothetical protein CCOS01_11718 [Colletotrichum costaricense]
MRTPPTTAGRSRDRARNGMLRRQVAKWPAVEGKGPRKRTSVVPRSTATGFS